MSHRFKFTRPVVFLDLETTAIPVHEARVVEIACTKLCPDGETITRRRLINPEVPIPQDAWEVHGIKDEDVRDMPPFRKVAKSLAEFLDGADLAGFNIIRYDLPVLCWEFGRAGVDFQTRGRKVVDAQRIYHSREKRGLSEAVRFYLDREHVGAHGAEADVKATIDILDGQIDRYQDLPVDIAGLAEASEWDENVDPSGWSTWTEDGFVIRKGKYEGRTVMDVYRADNRYFREFLMEKCDGILPLTRRMWADDIEQRLGRVG